MLTAAVLLVAIASSAGPGVCTGCEGIPFKLRDVQFVSASEAWATASYLPRGNGSGVSTVLHTTDGGRRWRRVPFVWQQGAETPPAVAFVGKHGWIGSDRLSITSDGGLHWSHRPSDRLRAVQFFDATHGYAAGANDFRTTADGGASWSRTELPIDLVDLMSFTDRNHGVIAGSREHDPRVLLTGDGGNQWTSIDLPRRPYAIAQTLAWANGQTAFLVLWGMNDAGSELLRTTDGGRTWSRHPDASLQGKGNYIKSIVIAPDGRGALFADGFMATTTDRGATWKRAPFAHEVSSCQLRDGAIVCAAGMKLLTFPLP
jgi:photosystem II stability/assembly factor-like uncharacterized protein